MKLMLRENGNSVETGRAPVMAKGVLCFFFGICYDDAVAWANDHSPLQGTATTTLNLRSVPAGVYLLRVRDADGKTWNRKVVVE